jgi:hypothetical protein
MQYKFTCLDSSFITAHVILIQRIPVGNIK